MRNLEEDFLEHLLKTYYTSDSYIQNIINGEIIKQAINSFLVYYENEDRIGQTNHLDIIKAIFIENRITNKNCLAELSISSKTFYRYKQRYLEIFKSFLLKGMDIESYQKEVFK